MYEVAMSTRKSAQATKKVMVGETVACGGRRCVWQPCFNQRKELLEGYVCECTCSHTCSMYTKISVYRNLTSPNLEASKAGSVTPLSSSWCWSLKPAGLAGAREGWK